MLLQNSLNYSNWPAIAALSWRDERSKLKWVETRLGVTRWWIPSTPDPPFLVDASVEWEWVGRDAIKIFIPQPKIKAKKEVDKNGVGNTHNCHRGSNWNHLNGVDKCCYRVCTVGS